MLNAECKFGVVRFRGTPFSSSRIFGVVGGWGMVCTWEFLVGFVLCLFALGLLYKWMG